MRADHDGDEHAPEERRHESELDASSPARWPTRARRGDHRAQQHERRRVVEQALALEHRHDAPRDAEPLHDRGRDGIRRAQDRAEARSRCTGRCPGITAMKKTRERGRAEHDEQDRQPGDRAEVAPELDRGQRDRRRVEQRRQHADEDDLGVDLDAPGRTGAGPRRSRSATRSSGPAMLSFGATAVVTAITTIARMTIDERVHRRQTTPSSRTASRSATSSATEASIARAGAVVERRAPRRRGSRVPSDVTGNEQTRPSGTPYSPRETTAAEVQPSPRAELLVAHVLDRGVGGGCDRRRSAHLDDLGAAPGDARDEDVVEPRRRRLSAAEALGERVDHRHAAHRRVRDIRELRRRVIAPDRDAARSRRAARRGPRRAGPTARLWSSRVSAVNRSAGTSRADAAAMSAFVLAGLPTTTTRTSSAAAAPIAAPCGPKMPAFAASRSARSMPGPRGRAPTSSAMLQPSNATRGSSVTSTSRSSGNAQSCSSSAAPSAARIPCGISSSRSRTGRSGPSISPAAMRKSRA